MAVTKQRKQEILQELVHLFKEAKSVASTKYSGTSVNDINALRGKMFEQNLKLKVAKKTLIKIAAKEAGYEEIPEAVLEGPVALVFGMEDEVTAPKAVKTAGKELDTLGLLGGFMDGKVLSQAEITQLADIPSFEVLMTQFVRALNGPVSGFHGVLHGTLRNFAGVLNAIKEEKEKNGGEMPAAEEAPAAEAETPAPEEAKEEAAAEAPAEDAAPSTDEAKPAEETPAEEAEAPEADAEPAEAESTDEAPAESEEA